MATQPEIETLKAQWRHDPCWDIYSTDGFEEHEKELREYQAQAEREWADKANERVGKKCEKLGCTPATLAYIELLEYRIQALELLVKP